MSRRLFTGTGILILLLSLGACSWPLQSDPNMPSRQACPPGLDKAAYMSADLYRPLDGGGNGIVAISVAITIAAAALDPDFEGTMFSDLVVTRLPRVLERSLPYTGRACMPPDKPVAWVFRATLAEVPDQAYDNLQCQIDSGSTADSVIYAQQIRRVDAADLMPGAPGVQVTCTWVWVPEGYNGPVPQPPVHPV